MEKKKWTEQDNKTLTELHETSKYYKELYRRVGRFYRMMYKILGFTCVISSSVSTSIFWIDTSQNSNNYLNNSGNMIDETDNDLLLKALLGVMLVSTILQNIISFIDISNDYLESKKVIESAKSLQSEKDCGLIIDWRIIPFTWCKKLSSKANKEINIRNLEEELYTHNLPDPDILIRTGGTKRLSNFLLWQLAYTEIFFINKLWPDFNEKDFNKVVAKFYKIKRNFGKI